MYLMAYELALQGMSCQKVGKALGFEVRTFRRLLRTKPALRKVFEKAASNPGGDSSIAIKGQGERFLDYAYRRMPSNLQTIWNKINQIDAGPNGDGEKEYVDAFERIDRLFTGPGGKRERQSLWFHALVCSNFNPSEACRKVGISYPTLQLWKKEENFVRLIEHLDLMKKDLGDAAWFRLLIAGEPSIVKLHQLMFNADRGFVLPKKQSGEPDPEKKQTFNLNVFLSNMPLAQKKQALVDLQRQKIQDTDGQNEIIDVTPKLPEKVNANGTG